MVLLLLLLVVLVCVGVVRSAVVDGAVAVVIFGVVVAVAVGYCC